MIVRNTLAVLGVLVFGVCSHADDLKELQGTWAPVSAQMGPQVFSKESLQHLRLQIRQDKYLVQMGQLVDQGYLRLGEDKKPATMDIVGTAGPNSGKTFPAIYQIDGDTLTICYSLEGKERPKMFRVSQDFNYFLVTYKRAK